MPVLDGQNGSPRISMTHAHMKLTQLLALLLCIVTRASLSAAQYDNSANIYGGSVANLVYGQPAQRVRCIACHNPFVRSGGDLRKLPLAYQEAILQFVNSPLF